jgi:hypothetical protein
LNGLKQGVPRETAARLFCALGLVVAGYRRRHAANTMVIWGKMGFWNIAIQFLDDLELTSYVKPTVSRSRAFLMVMTSIFQADFRMQGLVPTRIGMSKSKAWCSLWGGVQRNGTFRRT